MTRALLITAHAACKGHAPENTLAGVRRALELGADALEVDVQCTADGVPVLLHDETVDRTTDGRGSIREMTLAQARLLDAGARTFDGAFAGERIPTLEETLELTRGRALLVLEIKQVGIEEAVLAVVRQLDALGDCTAHSFFPQVVAAMRRAEPRLPCSLLTNGVGVTDWDELLDSVLSLHAQGVAVLYGCVDEALVRKARRRSLSLYTWTVNEEPEMRRLASLGVDGVTSDYPERVRAVLGADAAGASR